MALSPVPMSAKYGFIPGSQSAGQAMGYGAGYQGIGSLITPDAGDYFSNMNAQENAAQDLQMKKKKFDLLSGLFGGGGMMGSGNASASYKPPTIPAPQYLNAGPVWSQSQIDAQSNLQRNNLLTQANNQSRDFSQGMASRGFSPFSPFAMQNQQNNLMHANAGAAANETNLNFNSAQANSDARLKAGSINAGLYGDYTKSLLGQGQFNADYQLRSQSQHQDFIGQLLRSLA